MYKQEVDHLTQNDNREQDSLVVHLELERGQGC